MSQRERNIRKKLVNKQTSSEKKTMGILKDLGIHFLKQVQIGRFYADFIGKDQNFVLEIDGRHHYLDQSQVTYDEIRTAFFNELGLKVFRIKNEEVSIGNLSFLTKLPKVSSKEMREKIWYSKIKQNYGMGVPSVVQGRSLGNSGATSMALGQP